MSSGATFMTVAAAGVCSAVLGFWLSRFTRRIGTPALAPCRRGPAQMSLLVRKDLQMGKGKQATQCAHATLGAYRRAVRRFPADLMAWEGFGQAKVALQIQDEAELMEMKSRSEQAGLCTYVVYDAGRTQIAPDTATVLAIGPAPKSFLQTLTGHLKLL